MNSTLLVPGCAFEAQSLEISRHFFQKPVFFDTGWLLVSKSIYWKQFLEKYRQLAYHSEMLLIFPNVNKAGFQNNSGTFKNWTELYLYNKIENNGLFWYGVDWQLCWNLHYVIFLPVLFWNPAYFLFVYVRKDKRRFGKIYVLTVRIWPIISVRVRHIYIIIRAPPFLIRDVIPVGLT